MFQFQETDTIVELVELISDKLGPDYKFQKTTLPFQVEYQWVGRDEVISMWYSKNA